MCNFVSDVTTFETRTWCPSRDRSLDREERRGRMVLRHEPIVSIYPYLRIRRMQTARDMKTSCSPHQNACITEPLKEICNRDPDSGPPRKKISFQQSGEMICLPDRECQAQVHTTLTVPVYSLIAIFNVPKRTYLAPVL